MIMKDLGINYPRPPRDATDDSLKKTKNKKNKKTNKQSLHISKRVNKTEWPIKSPQSILLNKGDMRGIRIYLILSKRLVFKQTK